MSKQHPIIAITGSSGAGTSTVRVAMEHIFRRDGFDDRPPRATPSPRTMTKREEPPDSPRDGRGLHAPDPSASHSSP